MGGYEHEHGPTGTERVDEPIPQLTCPHCGYEWTPKVRQPKRCPGRNLATGKICSKWL